MLVAACAISFVSCDKKTAESETHSQTFTLGEASYDIEVQKVKDLTEIESSSVDYEGGVDRYILATGGEITISKDGDIYTIDMTDMQFNGVEGIFTSHYVGTMPYFDFPF